MTMCKLSRNVPAHRKTVKFTWIRHDFVEMNEQYREVRSRFRKPMDSCFWCGHKIANGEMIALGHIERRGNVVLCQSCAREANHE